MSTKTPATMSWFIEQDQLVTCASQSAKLPEINIKKSDYALKLKVAGKCSLTVDPCNLPPDY